MKDATQGIGFKVIVSFLNYVPINAQIIIDVQQEEWNAHERKLAQEPIHTG